ncbi:hypothetical protein E0H89_03645 [Acinetobacter sp. ANC 3781]|uniref:hypothetical protein n=1 Tax=Acinetobacter sp. ANC 3781 TaxID=2529835 RepID=UPI00103D738D|nr:hypothetical protein [Acinetobacter sp. ANC 3781]TCB79358.1 hypothetical protein E0H89_03645 [Acinetobacter sp. ANC 3781]
MSEPKRILREQFIEHFLFDYTDKDEFEIQMLSEIFEGIYYQKDKHFKPESKYWQVFRCLQDQQAKINQHQLEIHALGQANLNQAMMLAKKQEEIDSLKTQLNNMEACYIGVKKERDELQDKSQCIRNLVDQRNLAENMLRKISIVAQKKLPTFGTALRFNDEVREILRGEHE